MKRINTNLPFSLDNIELLQKTAISKKIANDKFIVVMVRMRRINIKPKGIEFAAICKDDWTDEKRGKAERIEELINKNYF